MPLARISLTFSRHFSLSFITSGRSSGLHPVSSHSCCIYVRAVRPAFARPYVWVDRITSLMSLSLLLQQCLACLVHLTWIVFMMGGRWPWPPCQCTQKYNQTGDISTLGGTSLKLVDKFTYLGSSVSSTEKDIDTLTKAISWTAITQECCKQYWTSPGGNTQQGKSVYQSQNKVVVNKKNEWRLYK